jgi:hypothetical protein
VGSDPLFGKWVVSNSRRMHYRSDGFWELEVPLDNPLASLTYKYVLVDDRNGAIFWEGGEDRVLYLTDYLQKNDVVEFRDTWRVSLSFFRSIRSFLFCSHLSFLPLFSLLLISLTKVYYHVLLIQKGGLSS